MRKVFSLLLLLVGIEALGGVRYSQEVRVIDPQKKHLNLLARHPELIIDHVNRLGYEVYGPSGLQNWLRGKQIQFVPAERLMKSALSGYPAPEAIIKKLQELQARFPQLITLIEIGKSVEGRPLVFARLTGPATKGRAMRSRPEFKYIANMHGDEIAGRELMIRLIEELAVTYGSSAKATALLDNTQVYIMPSMNPDGANRRSRFNARGADLNRSFPDFTTSDNVNDWTNREPEVQAVMKFQAQHQFKLSANFHGGAEVVNYPWDTARELFPHDTYVKTLSLDYAKAVPYIFSSPEFKNGITNGYAWYEVNNGMQDWSYYWYRDIQVTIELTNAKWPEYAKIDQYYQANRQALFNYIEAVHTVP